MLSLATGHDVKYLTGPVARGRESYYTGAVDAGEPPGLWFGAGAEKLGLSGIVDADLMEAVYTHLLDPRDEATHSRSTWGEAPDLATSHRKYRSAEDIYKGLLADHPGAGPEERAELLARAERSARQAVSFIDATFSAPKSVTVMGVAFERAASDARLMGDHESAAAWDAHARAVEDAVMAGARAAIEYLQAEAGYSRIGHHGGGSGRWIDAHEFVVAQFLQHDSRDGDPQLHVHQAILNRVLCADGTWRTLDSRAIHNLRGAAAAIAERVMEAHLTRALGVRFETRPDGKAREVIGVRQEVIDLFSSRRRAVTAKTRELVDAYAARYGRQPNALELTRLSMQATLATRAAKSHDVLSRGEQLDRWAAALEAEVGTSLSEVARSVVALSQQADPAATWSPQDVIERALARAAVPGSSFSRSDLIRAVSDELPAHLGMTPERIQALLEGVADDALGRVVRHAEAADTSEWPEDLRLDNGSSVFEGPGSGRYSTDGQFRAEEALRTAAIQRGAARLTPEQANEVVLRFAASGRELGIDQAAALHGVLTSGAWVEVLSAAPGTGKSFVVGALADAWTDPITGTTGRVFGLAPSQVAAGVLTEEGLNAANTAAWLGAQRRLSEPGRPIRDGDAIWQLREGDLVVVDEANMTSTDQLAEIQRRCAAAGAKLLLVGDPRQLAAVGPGGALADVADHGIAYELTEVRRFNAQWERTASLRLRDGDTSVLGEYAKHGRLRDAGTTEQAETSAARAWLADTLSGRESLLMVNDNATAARVSAALRAELVDLHRVEEAGVALGMDGWEGVVAGVGDLVQARRNGWELIGFDGNPRAPINRDTYRVTALRPDGGLTVAPIRSRDGDLNEEVLGEPIALPAAYVASDLALAYASTVHAAEGRTVDTSHSVLGAGTNLPGLLVPMTRGRDCNTAWVVTTAVAADSESGQALTTEPRTARAVLADVMDNAQTERTALADREAAELAARSAMTHLDRLIDLSAQVTTGRTAATLDRLAATGAITAGDRRALAADEALGTLERLLRTAELSGHDPNQVLSAAAEQRSLHGAGSPAQVLHHRITTALSGRLTPHIAAATDLIPTQVEEGNRRGWLQERADDADTRRHELGAQTALEAPQWALDALGPVPAGDGPDDVVARQEWEQRAGWAATWREVACHTDDTDALGAAPARGLVEKSALFRKAHEELRLLDVGAEEANLSDGQLRARVRAYERERNWAPRDVTDELAATHQQAEKVRTDAEVWTARAEATTDPDERDQLHASAVAARAEVEELHERIAELDTADDARAHWYTHSAITRDNAHRSASELRARGIDPDDTSDHVTGDEWVDAHDAEQAEADRHREVHDEHELTDHHPEPVLDDAHQYDTTQPDPAPAEAITDDVREISTAHPSETADQIRRSRIPTADETAEDVGRAQSALAEIAARREADAARAEQEAAREAEEAARAEELTQWSQQDRVADGTPADGMNDEPVLER